jgi:hypothetical protein
LLIILPSPNPFLQAFNRGSSAALSAAAAAAGLSPPAVASSAASSKTRSAAGAAALAADGGMGSAGASADAAAASPEWTAGMQLMSAIVGCAAVGTVMWSEFVLKDTGEGVYWENSGMKLYV